MRRNVIIVWLIMAWLIPGIMAANGGSDKETVPVPSARSIAAPLKTAAATESARLAEVSRVEIQSKSAVETRVDVSTSRPIVYRVLRLKNPERLVVDIEDARNTAHRVYRAPSAWLKGVRVGQFRDSGPAIVRVVADLLADPAYDVHSYPGGVRIELRSRPAGARPSAPNRVPAVPTAVLPPPLPGSQVEPGLLASASPVFPPPSDERAAARPDPGPAAPPSERANSGTTQPGSSYENALPPVPGSNEVTAAPRPVAQLHPAESARTAEAAKILAANAQTESAPAVVQGQEAAPPPPLLPQDTRPRYTGEPISLNLKDVDLKDFFRLVHEISGLNIIVDPNVTGNVTMVLDAVPWDQALDIVLKNNRLDKTLEGNVLRIARVETIAAEQEATAKLTAAKEQAQPLVTVFRPINYAKAATLATILKSWAGGGALSTRGTILVDDRTNTLIISDIQTQIPVIQAIVTKLDRKAKQVAIEARIILATASFQRTLQSALSGGTLNRSGSVVTGGSTGTGAFVTPGIPTTLPAPAGTTRVTIGQTSAGGFGAYAISNAGARYFLNAAIAAAETKSEAKTLSRPTIITQNNVPGKVQQGSQIPVQTSINNTIAIQYIAATLALTVTPQVTEDGNVFMVIDVQNASPGPVLTQSGPSINTQSANTSVLVPDGGTVVFGGVTVTTRTRSATYIPLIGNVPILGHLFKNSNVQDSDNELLFFVSPKVLPG